MEKYQVAYKKYQKNRTKLHSRIATNARVKEQAKQNFVDKDYALKLNYKMHNQNLDLRKPLLSDFYKPCTSQKQGEMIYVREMALALGLAASHFL